MPNSQTFKYQLPDDCPKVMGSNTIDDKRKYYRVCKSDEIKDEDFIPHLFDKNKKKRCEREFEKIKRDKNKLKKKKCGCASVSLFNDKMHARQFVKQFGKNAGKYIAEGEIGKEHGIIFATPSDKFPSHSDWHPYQTVKYKKVFNL